MCRFHWVLYLDQLLMVNFSHLGMVRRFKELAPCQPKCDFNSFLVLFCLFRSRYTLDDSLVSCSVDFNSKSISVLSFNIALFGCVFFIPLALIIGINIKTLSLVSSLNDIWFNQLRSSYSGIWITLAQISHTNHLSVITRNTYAYTKRMQNEKRLTISAFVVVGKLEVCVSLCGFD